MGLVDIISTVKMATKFVFLSLCSLKSSNPGLFQICPISGMVYASRPILNPESGFEILVKAADNGSKELFSLSRISLKMHPRPPSNESLHPPRVLEKSSRVQIFENDPIGHLVALIGKL